MAAENNTTGIEGKLYQLMLGVATLCVTMSEILEKIEELKE